MENELIFWGFKKVLDNCVLKTWGLLAWDLVEVQDSLSPGDLL